MMISESGQKVVSFASALRNASRLGTYADLVVDMFTSGSWRSYETALGPENWRAHEFDYFLIACDARHEDLVRILMWDTVRAAKMAEAMSGPPSRYRRALTEASAAWQSGTPQTLLDRAQANGWLRKDRPNRPILKRAPISQRAVQRAQKTTRERQERLRRRHQVRDRRAMLDRLVRTILSKTSSAREVAYIIDELRSASATHRLHIIRPTNQ
jgi:hypothetical protein